MKEVRLCLRQEDLREEDLEGAVAVVFDALRATSTVAAALAAGATAVVPCVDEEEALRLRRDGGVVLGGERRLFRIEGFDLGNSPREYVPAVVTGRVVALVTTNGTRAVRRAARASRLCAGAFVNAAAAARWVADGGEERVVLVCAGTSGRFSLEDMVAAGAVAAELAAAGASLDDAATAALLLFQTARVDLPGFLRVQARNARLLEEAGLGEDVAWCARLNAVPVVPIYREGRLMAFSA